MKVNPVQDIWRKTRSYGSMKRLQVMTRRQMLMAAGAAVAVSAVPAPGQASLPSGTKWIVRGSEGFDAISFLGPLSGDAFYARHYEEAVAAFAPHMPEKAMTALRSLKSRASQADVLLSPFLAMRVSGAPDATLSDVILSLDRPEEFLRQPFEASPYWKGAATHGWDRFLQVAPIARSILAAMREAGFAEFHSSIFQPKAVKKFPPLRRYLAGIDIVDQVSRFTGRTLEPNVEVVLLEFCKPHGIKVIGQKFLCPIDWTNDGIARTSVHELLHPPIPMDGPVAGAALAILNEDALIWRIIAEHDRSFGYNTLEGLFNEDLTSALDQIVADRLGFARDPADRWNNVDGGMHVLAAALYGLMKESGFAEAGRPVDSWLTRIIEKGSLSPRSLRTSASRVLGRPIDQLWTTPGR